MDALYECGSWTRMRLNCYPYLAYGCRADLAGFSRREKLHCPDVTLIELIFFLADAGLTLETLKMESSRFLLGAFVTSTALYCTRLVTL